MLKTIVKQAARAAGLHVSKRNNVPWGISKFADFAALCPAPQVIFDVGANVGQTVAELREVIPSAHIYSFEPVPFTFARLVEALRDDPLAEAVNVALGAAEGSAEITAIDSSGQNTLNAAAKPEAPTVSIRIRPLDDFCAERQIERIDLLKIDTEGFENQVLEGAREMLAKGAIRFVLAECEFERNPTEPHGDFFEIYDRLRAAGMRLVSFYTGGVDGDGWRWGDVLFMRPQPGRPVRCSPHACD